MSAGSRTGGPIDKCHREEPQFLQGLSPLQPGDDDAIQVWIASASAEPVSGPPSGGPMGSASR